MTMTTAKKKTKAAPKSVWSIAEAKANFSKVVTAAQTKPQTITRRGEKAVLVVEAAKHERSIKDANAPVVRPVQDPGWTEVLRLSAELRAAGGADLEIPPRKDRRSQFPREHG